VEGHADESVESDEERKEERTSSVAADMPDDEQGPSPRSKCALKCSLESIGVYWACAAVCIAKLAPNVCITVGCVAAVAAADVPCLTHCPNATGTAAPHHAI